MSFDIWFSCFQHGNVAKFPLAVAEGALGHLIVRREPECWFLKSGAVYIDDEEVIDGFAVNRPPGDDAFWEGVLSILRQTPTVLYWPEGGAVVADDSAIAHMPADMIEIVGMPTVVSTVAEILHCIETS
jgi:hypothetical protein